MQHSAERSLADRLTLAHCARTASFLHDVAHRTTLVTRIAAWPDLVRVHRELMMGFRREENLAFFLTLAPLLIREGLSYVEFRDPHGRRLAGEGRAARDAEFFTSLAGSPSRPLIWDGRPVLRVEQPVRDATLQLIVGEQPLDDLKQVVFDVSEMGASGGISVCTALSESTMRCLPLRFNPHAATYERRMHDLPLPMSYALDRQRGVAKTRDYRNREVFAAYGPIGDPGLGLVVKVDAA